MSRANIPPTAGDFRHIDPTLGAEECFQSDGLSYLFAQLSSAGRAHAVRWRHPVSKGEARRIHGLPRRWREPSAAPSTGPPSTAPHTRHDSGGLAAAVGVCGQCARAGHSRLASQHQGETRPACRASPTRVAVRASRQRVPLMPAASGSPSTLRTRRYLAYLPWCNQWSTTGHHEHVEMAIGRCCS